MERHIVLVQNNPVEGREDEFNEWYTKEHLPDILRIDGWIAAQRFRMHEVQPSVSRPYPYRYLAIYEMEGDVQANLERLDAAVSRLRISSALGEPRVAHVFVPITGRVTRRASGRSAASL